MLFLVHAFLKVHAQKPIVNSLSKSYATVEEEIAIAGSGFGNSIADVKVFFGPVSASVVSVTENLIKVKVPAGTTYGSVAVTNLTSGLTGYSNQQFGLSFGGKDFDLSKFDDQEDFDAGAGVFDLCLCDFDGDGKTDVATSNDNTPDVGIFKNISSIGNINFEERIGLSLSVLSPTRNITCGDIDGDGKPDLVVSGGGSNGSYKNTVFVLRNRSTGPISFDSPQLLNIDANGAARIVIRDLDLDGKPELIVTNNSNNTISIFPNNSTAGNISFSSVQTVTVSGALNLNGLAVEDLNNDGLPEIIVNTLQQSDAYVLKNTSTTGAFSFEAPIVLKAQGSIVNLAVGDLDNDGKPDIVLGNIANSNVALFRNTSTADNVQFAPAKTYGIDARPWGLTLGDVDGDGTQDIILVSHIAPAINVLLNNSLPGNLSFSQENVLTTGRSRNIKFGDLDNDAKPDFVFIDIENNKLSVIKNKGCIVPEVTPVGPHTVCAGTPLKLSVTEALAVTYQWQLNGIAIPGATSSSIEPDQSGTYTVTITSVTGECINTSEGVAVVIDTGDGIHGQMDPITPVCVGEDIVLSATEISGATYAWSGPNGFSITTTTHTTTVANATTAKAGEYSVIIKSSACDTPPLTANAVVYGLPNPVITTTGSTSFCEDDGSVLLSTSAGFNAYQWKKNGTIISGATASSYTAKSSGDYTVSVTSANGCSNESKVIAVNKFSPPEANFIAPEAKCVEQEVKFENTSLAEGNTVSYIWDFGDGTTATDSDPAHVYTTPGTYQVKLTASYSPTCKSEIIKAINIKEASPIEIVADGNTEFCQGDSVKLSVPTDFQQYEWSNGSLKPITYVKTDGTVDVTITTAEGCVMYASINIYVSKSDVTATTDSYALQSGETAQLSATGAFTYSWEPAEGLSDPSISNPIAAPKRTTTYVVTGTDDIGCSDTAEITITVDNDLNVIPKKLFVPETDITWKIEQMEYFPECTVIIFNKQGLKLFEESDYASNSWNGTYQGQPVAKGVYYFVIRCSSDNNVKTGSITLMR